MWKIARNQQRTMSRQRGDTLVEVLVAIVVVSTVIGGAYVVSNNSLQSTRATQERSNALKLAQSQLEQLKSLVNTSSAQIFGGSVPTSFCLYSNSGTTQVESTTVPAQDQYCVVDTSGTYVTSSATQPQYTFVIQRTGNNFQLTESWVDISGHLTDSLKLDYRIYQ